eukprot:gb/GECH01002934.1/.p1 GENE.gb/GECH01002934.1/~~gb/GECH01002934.1/.p1  ORF type:complete len:326 (+),score=63.15 gb/GECH01002934.1/:1-978(+)
MITIAILLLFIIAIIFWLIFVPSSPPKYSKEYDEYVAECNILPPKTRRNRCKINEDTEIYYELFGDDDAEHKIVFVTGLSSPLEWWHPQLKHLVMPNNKYQCLVYDNRGVGRSSTPPGVYHTQHMAEDVLCLMDAVGWYRAHVVGISMGGMISQKLAQKAPDRILSLTLCATYARLRFPIPISTILFFLTQMLPLPERFKVKHLMNNLYSPEFINDRRFLKTAMNIELAQRKAYFNTRGTIRQLLGCLAHRIEEHDLPSQIPVMLITGTSDSIIHHSDTEVLEKMFNRIENRPTVHRFSNVGHNVTAECSDQVNNLLTHHFEKVQ